MNGLAVKSQRTQNLRITDLITFNFRKFTVNQYIQSDFTQKKKCRAFKALSIDIIKLKIKWKFTGKNLIWICCPTIFPPKICIFVDWDGTFLPVDGDHGDGEERNANVGVLDQRLDNAPGGIAARIVSAGYEAVDAERHNQQTEAQIRNTQTATQTFVSRLHHCNIKSPRWDFIGKKIWKFKVRQVNDQTPSVASHPHRNQ